jgi:hypothetical protein
MFRHAIAPRRFFLQVPNDVIRHPRLNCDAKALLLYVLSLPEGVDEPLQRSGEKVGLKKSAFTVAKRQLIAEGYLHEWREQGRDGRWGTEQLVANVPLGREDADRVRRGAPPSVRKPAVGEPSSRAVGHSQEQPRGNTPNLPPSPPGLPAAAPEREAAAPPSGPTAGAEADDELVERAAFVLAGLSHSDPRLRLGGREIAGLAPQAAQWLERGCSAEALRLALASGLPQAVANPVGFLRSRLQRKMPLPAPPPPPSPEVMNHAMAECGSCRDPLPRGRRGGDCRHCQAAPVPLRATGSSGLAAVRAALSAGLATAFALP